MLRAVLDTNVFISGIKSQLTPPGRILDAWREKRFVLITSPRLLAEIQEVLLRPEILHLLKKTPKEVGSFITTLTQKAYLTEGKLEVNVLKKDADDNMVLACAEEGIATQIVTGNKKDFPFTDYKGIQILTPREFLELLDKSKL